MNLSDKSIKTVLNKIRNKGIYDHNNNKTYDLNNNAIILFKTKTRKIGLTPTTVCHVNLKQLKSYTNGIAPKSIYTTIQLEELSKEAIAYYKWLFNKSVYSSAFVYKNVYVAFNRGVKLNDEAEEAILAGGCIALRLPWEFPEKLDSWYSITKICNNKDLAYIICMFLDKKDRNSFYFNKYQEYLHLSLRSNMDKTYVKNFLNRIHQPTLSYNVHYTYNNINSIFFNSLHEQNLMINDIVRSIYKKYVKKVKTNQWGYVKEIILKEDEEKFIMEICNSILED